MKIGNANISRTHLCAAFTIFSTGGISLNTIDIIGKNYLGHSFNVRNACRGILFSGGNILLTYEVNTDRWFIPGGGLEAGESLTECCIRELGEETGCLVMPIEHYLTINEYYEDWLFVSHYFLCEIIGKTDRKLTEREIEVGLEPRWVPFEESVDIFSNYKAYFSSNEMKAGAYLREYRALSCLKSLDKIIL